eukprot:PhM_4_TR15034/c0_g2_i1/m.61499/K01110/PTEN; phosphatidylinositol-3,4,5-trisphosphate 3-phosphatase and dual-specificity protein phosphatase PTEN
MYENASDESPSPVGSPRMALAVSPGSFMGSACLSPSSAAYLPAYGDLDDTTGASGSWVPPLPALNGTRASSPPPASFPHDFAVLVYDHTADPRATLSLTVDVNVGTTADELLTLCCDGFKLRGSHSAGMHLLRVLDDRTRRGGAMVSLADYITGNSTLHTFRHIRMCVLERRRPCLELVALRNLGVVQTTTTTTSRLLGERNGFVEYEHRHVHTHSLPDGRAIRTENVNTTSMQQTTAESPGPTGGDGIAGRISNVLPTQLSNAVRSLVSKKKLRFQADGYDLDLTYITPQIIAMGFPSEGTERLYRNPIDDVERFLDQYHGDHCMVYNLCSERTYPGSRFHGRCRRYPFNDHCPPPFPDILRFCIDVDKFLLEDKRNVISVHCKAGKGRTGTMIAAYMVFSGIAPDADSALALFAGRRTHNAKGVTIPSQMRYVRYFAHTILNFGALLPPERVFWLRKVVLRTTPRCHPLDGSCEPYVTVHTPRGKVYDSRDGNATTLVPASHPSTTVPVPHNSPVMMRGDVKVMAFHRNRLPLGTKAVNLLHAWVHTSFVPADGVVVLTKSELDVACKDRAHKTFDENFSVELHFDLFEEL